MIPNNAHEYHWQDDAACAQIGFDLFFPEKGGSDRQATRICAACPVIATCLQYALDTETQHGIFGGMNASQRRKHRDNLGLPTIRRPITHCPQDHEYTEANSRITADGARHCRKCSVIAGAKRRIRKAA